MSNGEDPGEGAISSRRAFGPVISHARLIVVTPGELNGCEASVNKNAVTRTTGMPMLQRERTKERAQCFLCRSSCIRWPTAPDPDSRFGVS